MPASKRYLPQVQTHLPHDRNAGVDGVEAEVEEEAADAEETSFGGVTSACESATEAAAPSEFATKTEAAMTSEAATTSEAPTCGFAPSVRVRFVRFRFGLPAACSRISLADFAHVPH